MSRVRIALANLPYSATPDDSVTAVVAAITGAAAAARDSVGVVLGTERVVDGALRATAVVIDKDGTVAGFQDKPARGRAREPSTSAVVRPDGTLQSYQPYGKAGLLVADLDLTQATGLLTKRLRS